MIRISNIKIAPHKKQVKILQQEICRQLHIKPEQLLSWQIQKKSIDARKKDKMMFVYTVDAAIKANEAQIIARCKNAHVTIAQQIQYQVPASGTALLKHRPIIIGAGPAGLFATLLLAEQGYQPILLERGKTVEERTKDVELFWTCGQLNPCSNVQFGEGGAGTFSDGKLNTMIKNIRCCKVLETFVEHGAAKDILYDAKPHIGTDRLKKIIPAIRDKIIALGGEVHFNSHVTALLIGEHRQLQGVEINHQDKRYSQHVILAIGHSARDTFAQLAAQEIHMEPKPFAIGLRIEHPQEEVDKAQYGAHAPMAELGAADYKLTFQSSNGRAVYSFCMCPGGQVVAAASEPDHLVVNGMSLMARDGQNANSALVVSVTPEDFSGTDAMSGVAFQRQWEALAYQLGGSNYHAPAQLVGDFLNHCPSTSLGNVQSTYTPQITLTDLRKCLPTYVVEALQEAIPAFGQKIKGFDRPDAILIGVETRTSSPIRIIRDAHFQAIGIKGLYPCGEGAGYAGGIVSAAVDGIRVAEEIIMQYAPLKPNR